MKIEAHGSFFDISEDGSICNMGHPDNIRPPWKALVEDIKQAYIENCADQLHSIYVRGSVARDLAVLNVSDVDSFAVTRPGSALQEMPWAEEAERKLSEAYPFSAGVEFGLFRYEGIFEIASDSEA